MLLRLLYANVGPCTGSLLRCAHPLWPPCEQLTGREHIFSSLKQIDCLPTRYENQWIHTHAQHSSSRGARSKKKVLGTVGSSSRFAFESGPSPQFEHLLSSSFMMNPTQESTPHAPWGDRWHYTRMLVSPTSDSPRKRGATPLFMYATWACWRVWLLLSAPRQSRDCHYDLDDRLSVNSTSWSVQYIAALPIIIPWPISDSFCVRVAFFGRMVPL